MASVIVIIAPPSAVRPPPVFHCHLPHLLIVECPLKVYLIHLYQSNIDVMMVSILCACKKVIKIALITGANYGCGGGRTPKPSACAITQGGGWCLCTWLGRPHASGHSRGQSHLTPWLTPVFSIILSQEGFSGLVQLYVGYCTLQSQAAKYSLNSYIFSYPFIICLFRIFCLSVQKSCCRYYMMLQTCNCNIGSTWITSILHGTSCPLKIGSTTALYSIVTLVTKG
jgi:hypothetical protein